MKTPESRLTIEVVGPLGIVLLPRNIVDLRAMGQLTGQLERRQWTYEDMQEKQGVVGGST